MSFHFMGVPWTIFSVHQQTMNRNSEMTFNRKRLAFEWHFERVSLLLPVHVSYFVTKKGHDRNRTHKTINRNQGKETDTATSRRRGNLGLKMWDPRVYLSWPVLHSLMSRDPLCRHDLSWGRKGDTLNTGQGLWRGQGHGCDTALHDFYSFNGLITSGFFRIAK